MSEQKWTKGPWKASGEWDSIHAIYDDECIYIGHAETGVGRDWIGVNPIGKERARANARLMAAAPDLYEALMPFASIEECGSGFLVTDEEHRNNGCHECEQVMTARAALKKAVGQ